MKKPFFLPLLVLTVLVSLALVTIIKKRDNNWRGLFLVHQDETGPIRQADTPPLTVDHLTLTWNPQDGKSHESVKIVGTMSDSPMWGNICDMHPVRSTGEYACEVSVVSGTRVNRMDVKVPDPSSPDGYRWVYGNPIPY
ncbi:MAG: hypothetical protein WC551_06770 [Patescibacteria group bacterium]